MTKLRYITHPEVTVDPSVAVTRWNLSPVGLARAHAIVRQPWASAIGRIVSSTEAKAVQTATILSEHLGISIEIREDLGENDRSATGFVAPTRFEALADAFFAEPTRSVAGWERADDAQRRIVAGLADLLRVTREYAPGVRRHDQPGQGHYVTVDLPSGRVEHPWRPIDHFGQS